MNRVFLDPIGPTNINILMIVVCIDCIELMIQILNLIQLVTWPISKNTPYLQPHPTLQMSSILSITYITSLQIHKVAFWLRFIHIVFLYLCSLLYYHFPILLILHPLSFIIIVFYILSIQTIIHDHVVPLCYYVTIRYHK